MARPRKSESGRKLKTISMTDEKLKEIKENAEKEKMDFSNYLIFCNDFYQKQKNK